MPVIYNNSVKNARLQVVADAIDVSAPGTLEILSGAGAVLAIFELADPCGAVSGQQLIFDTTPNISTLGEAAAGSGETAVSARIKDGAGTVIVSGLTAGEEDEDVVLDNGNIAAGQTVILSSAVITHG